MIGICKKWQLKMESCFRLLNSEIGNDPLILSFHVFLSYRFRLLNSEIGNDQTGWKKTITELIGVFVSLTRR